MHTHTHTHTQYAFSIMLTITIYMHSTTVHYMHVNSYYNYYVCMQKQHNYSDCGLYAIANAMAIWSEQQPECLTYDIQGMRRYLAGCFEDNLMHNFPAKKRNMINMTKSCEVMSVFCICKMPEEDWEKMISCDCCGEWFHDKYIHIPAEAWTNSNYLWQCADCQ